ncbi:6068_t:CDS:1 [Gigaspora margarita]|uniref:Conserved fungal protein n=2 Tax=Gigaspora margarita TaxID=4874 RepID=A0A8H3XDD2_GIGMA|nr:conserved fungal protein [Gigaspora margarita]CAG8807473.1 6068_t:CDS:1 [Gigaspora margarita]
MDHSGHSPESRGYPDESPEKALMASFRIAAESVAQLYKTSLNHTKRYDNGYEQCLRDLFEFVSSHPNVQQRQQTSSGDGRDAFISVDELYNFIQSKTEHLKSMNRRARDDATNVRHQPQQQTQHFVQTPQQISPFQAAATHTHSNSGGSPASDNIFGTDHDQFNFSLQPNIMYHPIQHEIDCIDTGQEGGIGILAGNDILKRRFGGSTESSFFSRSMPWEYPLIEPPTKKGRFRKDE